eukprot:1809716-Pyramimonas_sp.AAC.1
MAHLARLVQSSDGGLQPREIITKQFVHPLVRCRPYFVRAAQQYQRFPITALPLYRFLRLAVGKVPVHGRDADFPPETFL